MTYTPLFQFDVGVQILVEVLKKYLFRSLYTEKRPSLSTWSFFSYIRLTASSMHKCVICPSDVICASRVKSSKANIISLRNEVEQYHFCEAKISR